MLSLRMLSLFLCIILFELVISCSTSKLNNKKVYTSCGVGILARPGIQLKRPGIQLKYKIAVLRKCLCELLLVQKD
jgi:hypothetical protein